MTRLARLLLLLLLAQSAAGCRTPPWSCTPESCGALATAALPGEALGTWRGPAGEVLVLKLFETGSGEPVRRAGLGVLRDAAGTLATSQAYTFDGRQVLLEERLGGEARGPRVFRRMRLVEGGSTLQRFLPAALEDWLDPGTLGPAPGDEGAVVYTELEPMAAAMRALLDDPGAWGPPIRFEPAL